MGVRDGETGAGPATSRRGRVPPFIVMEVMKAAADRAAAGERVLHLEVGQPGLGAPPRALAAAAGALGREGSGLGYTAALGLPALRERIARHYGEWYGVEVDPRRVAVTVGASGAFILAFLAAFDAGDRVAVPTPGYPAYRNTLRALDVETVTVPAEAATRFQPTPAQLARIGGPLHGLVVASPANPTGTMLRGDELAGLAAFCRERRVRFVVDEIYHGLAYEDRPGTALAVAPDAIVVNSFSKYFCMTGWRLGWLVLPEELVTPVERLAQNLFISPSALSQHAALGAFEDQAELDGRIAAYRRNRDRLLAALRRAGLERVAPPDGAFYLYVDVGGLTADSVALCREVLERTGVAMTPGVDFDEERGHRFVRLSFAGGEGEVAEAAARLEAHLSGRAAGTGA
jgi:aspartate/methionine/tyrosine aminotransferase